MPQASQESVELDPATAKALANYLGTRPIDEAMHHFNAIAGAIQRYQRAGEAALVRNAEARGEIRGERTSRKTEAADPDDEPETEDTETHVN